MTANTYSITAYKISHILKNTNYGYEVRFEGVPKPVELRKEWFKASFICKAAKAGMIVPFELAYCVTVHSAQGGQWARVGFILDAEVDQRLFYTATTRAELQTAIFDENNLLGVLELSLPYGPDSRAISTDEQERDEPVEVLAEVVTDDEGDLAHHEAVFADWGAQPQATVVVPKPTHVAQSPVVAKVIDLEFAHDDLDSYLPPKSQLAGIYDSSARQYSRQAGFR